jgi:di/tricarboxylate transporter
MDAPQLSLLIILAATVAMFLWGRWRHDMVAAGALFACVLSGLVAPAEAFAGFGHPAVITVACVLILSRGLQDSGAVDLLARHVLPQRGPRLLGLVALVGLGALLSSVMNNVGAMALLMPLAIAFASRHGVSPGQVLMPLAFGTILGGMTTLIGTPPNLIVSGFRAQQAGEPFGMFDFTPVGLAVAAAGVAFIVLVGWRLVPERARSGIEGFESGAYLTEVRVPEDSPSVGRTLAELDAVLDRAGAQIVGLVRNEFRMMAPHVRRKVRAGDILVIEAEAEALAALLAELGVKLEEAQPAGHASPAASDSGADDQARGAAGSREEGSEMLLTELVVLPASALAGRTASDILLRSRYGLNLLAVSRQGKRSLARLRSMPMEAGDLLLIQGHAEATQAFASDYGCVPLAGRALRIPDRARALKSALVMLVAIALVGLGVLPAALAFALGVLASMVLRTVPPRSVYAAIDWPVVVLLAALMPVAGAMEHTGAAQLIADGLLGALAGGDPVIALALVLVVTMTLSDVMNNAATAAVMCPIAIGIAGTLDVAADPFLMAVAIGASCAFLTPIGHQNNTLILGPGGFRFGDYWRLGLPLEVLVVAVAMPMLLWIWPL